MAIRPINNNQQKTRPTSDEIYKIFDFEGIRLKLSSPQEILGWSYGEITKPETINYRTQKPEKDGLFSERIFGPTKDWECYCGKYKRIRYKGVICDKCGVEVTRSSVRRERMGHISLAVPVSHIWFLRSVPSKMGMILDKSSQELEQVVYFAGYIVTEIDENMRKQYLDEIDREFKTKSKEISGEEGKVSTGLLATRDRAKDQLRNLRLYDILSEAEYYDISLKYGPVFKAGTGAETLQNIFERIDLEKLSKDLSKELEDSDGAKRKKMMRRLRIIRGMAKASVRPEWMFMNVVPVIPPDLRPMVPLDGGRFATSDLNDLYRRVINRNNRLRRLIELKAPEVICRNEKRMLQEAVDALIDNSARRGQTSVTASTGQRRPLKSLADMLKGKQGRFRQNLLGKRVDYSGRSVIVVGPSLKIHECGLPKEMALELFKPFIIHKLIYDRALAHNVRSASRLIEQRIDEVWDILEEIIEGRYVLLNRAPTLHRLSIQAFKPVLIEGKALQIHPLVCHPFNADFDGDQMAVHIPLTKKALEESERVMMSKNNILKPSTGDPVLFPSQDMVLGCYYMTDIVQESKGQGKAFASEDEAILAYEFDAIDLRANIKVRKEKELMETSVGRVIFNRIIPSELGFVNKTLDSKSLKALVAEVLALSGQDRATEFLDELKKLGFKYVTKSGLSWGMDDLSVPTEKTGIVNESEKKVELIQNQYEEGLLTDEERYTQVVEVWTDAKSRISELLKEKMDKTGPVFAMINSGARGSWGQVAQMVGMKGLVSNPAGRTIELPVRASFKEGIDELGYFISTHGMRKGLVDTALRTAAAGYLTRRLVDVAQDIVVREVDCGDTIGRIIYREDAQIVGESYASFVFSRTAMVDIADPETGKVIVKKGEIINKELAQKIDQSSLQEVRVRSVIGCRTVRGVCQTCYGYDLGRNQIINIGEAIGIVTAQAIGEPGTQLTMKTFHMGGVAGTSDITQGLPRVEEIFEARTPRAKSIISDIDGLVSEIKEVDGKKVICITESAFYAKRPEKNANVKEFSLDANMASAVAKGDFVIKGMNLTEGHIDLQELYETAGMLSVERYIVKEVQKIYSSQGANINNKHFELIIRQMFSKVRVKEPGDSDFLPGEVVDYWQFERANLVIGKEKGKLAECERLLLGISKASLSTDSFLSAASFQETTRVLIDAAIMGKVDHLRGLKENVILGRLIPAGTGYRHSLAKEAANRKEAKV